MVNAKSEEKDLNTTSPVIPPVSPTPQPNIIEETKSDFIYRFNLNDEEISKLKRFPIRLEKRENKKTKRIIHLLAVSFCKTDKGKAIFETLLDETKFQVATLKNNLDPNKAINIFTAPIRFTKGITSLGKLGYTFELFLTDRIRPAFFFTDDQLELLEILKVKFDYVERQKINDDDADLQQLADAF